MSSDNPPADIADTISIHRRRLRRRSLIIIALAVLSVVLIACDLMTGPAAIPLDTIFKGLIDQATLQPVERVILFEVRVPQAALAALAGAALALAGAEMQTVLDNPLASPFTLGLSSAAALGAAIAIVTGLHLPLIPEGWMVPANAFAFVLLSVLALNAFVHIKQAGPEVVILFGIALVFSFNAILSLVQLYASPQDIQQIVFWTMGSLERARGVDVVLLGCTILVIFPLSLSNARQLTALRFGPEQAQSFGVNVRRLRMSAYLRISLLTGVAVALTGTIGFIGLVAPHIARMLLGEDHRTYLAGTALAGAILLSSAAIVSKLLIPGIAVPVGIVTAIVGVPVFILLLALRRPGQ